MLSLLSMRNDPFNLLFNDYDDLQSRVLSSESHYTIMIETPGFTEDEVSVEVKDKYLKVYAEHKEESKNKYFQRKISKSWTLPQHIDEEGIEAELKNGILTVKVPKKQLPKPKKIEIKSLPS